MTTKKIRLAVTSEGRDGLDSRVGQHFGRCLAYTLVDLEDGRIATTRVVDSPFATGHAPGEVPGFIADTESEVLLTGGIGRRAVTFFDQHGIQVSSGHRGTVAEAVDSWLAGTAGGPATCSGHQHYGRDHTDEPGHGDCGGAG